MDPEEQTTELYNDIQGVVQVEWLSALITAGVVLAITAVIAHLVTRFLRRVLSHDNSPLPSSTIFVNIARVFVWALGISVVLSSCLGIDVTAAIAALGIGGIAVSLGFQDTLSNLIGGLQMSITGLVRPGDHLEVGGKSGVVADVTWRHTTLVTPVGERVVVPNSVINKNSIVQLRPANVLVVPVVVRADEGCAGTVVERAAAMEQAAAAAATQVANGPVTARVWLSETIDVGLKGTLVLRAPEGVDGSACKDAAVRAIAPFTHPAA